MRQTLESLYALSYIRPNKLGGTKETVKMEGLYMLYK
jgi:hypothetical protein